MKWYGDCCRCAFDRLLHDPMTATLAEGNESALFENVTNLQP